MKLFKFFFGSDEIDSEEIYDFVWQAMTEKSWSDEVINNVKEKLLYDQVSEQDDVAEAIMRGIPEDDENEAYEYTADKQVAYSYGFEIDEEGTKIPLALYLMNDNPKFKRLDISEYSFEEEKPYSLVGFSGERNGEESTELIIQVESEHKDALIEFINQNNNKLVTEVVIRYSRKGRNQYRTWGTYSIDGTDHTGYILERPKGPNPTRLEKYKRIPSGTYNIGYSEDAGGKRKEFYYVTLYIVEHPAYKLHGGNRADDSEGCLLINYNSPENDSYPRANKFVDPNIPYKDRVRRSDKVGVANTYYKHSNTNNPAYKLRTRVFELEQEIKQTYGTENVVKKIIIDESSEKQEL